MVVRAGGSGERGEMPNGFPFRVMKMFWNFLSDGIQVFFCYVNEVTFGPHLRMETGCQGNQPRD